MKKNVLRLMVVFGFVIVIGALHFGCCEECVGDEEACPVTPPPTGQCGDGISPTFNCKGCPNEYVQWLAGNYPTCVDRKGNPSDKCSPTCVEQCCSRKTYKTNVKCYEKKPDYSDPLNPKPCSSYTCDYGAPVETTKEC